MDIRLLGRAHNLFMRYLLSIRHPINNIFFDGAIKKRRFLGNYANLGAQSMYVHVLNWHSVDELLKIIFDFCFSFVILTMLPRFGK